MARTPDPTTKITLLRASEEVFAANGLVNAKVEEITRRAGTSKGAFYLHFASKEEAFKQVAESFLARLEGSMPRPEDVDVPDDPVEALALWQRTDEAVYEFLWRNRGIVALLQTCQGDYVYLLDTFWEETHRRAMEWVALWKRKGMFRAEIDEDLSATILNGAHDALCRKTLGAREKPPLSRVVRDAQSLFVRAFGSPELIAALAESESAEVSRTLPAAPRPRRRASASQP